MIEKKNRLQVVILYLIIASYTIIQTTIVFAEDLPLPDLGSKLSAIKIDNTVTSWQVKLNDQTFGPLTTAEMKTKIIAGEILPTTFVSKWGATKWVPAAVEFDFPKTSTADPSPQKKALTETPPPATKPAQDASSSEPDTNPAQNNERIDSKSLEKSWYVAVDGQTTGPFTPSEMQQKIASGSLKPQALVSYSGSTEWVAADTVFPFEKKEPAPVTKWYVSKAGQADGPYTTSQMKSKIATGEVLPQTNIIQAGSQTWIAANTVFQFSAGPATPADNSAPAANGTMLSPTATVSLDNEQTRFTRQIKLGTGFAIAGLSAWSFGIILEVAGFAKFASDEDSGIGMMTGGVIFELTGPIFSAIGEKIVKTAVGQRNHRALRSRKLSAGAVYGLSWIFTGLSIGSLFLPYPVNIAVGLSFSTIGSTLRGVAAIAPLVRIRRYRRTSDIGHLGLTPFAMSYGGGLSLFGSF